MPFAQLSMCASRINSHPHIYQCSLFTETTHPRSSKLPAVSQYDQSSDVVKMSVVESLQSQCLVAKTEGNLDRAPVKGT